MQADDRLAAGRIGREGRGLEEFGGARRSSVSGGGGEGIETVGQMAATCRRRWFDPSGFEHLDARPDEAHEEGEGRKEGKGDGKGGGKGETPCRFYMSDSGCRRGRQCDCLHPTDETARAPTEHMRKGCPRKISKPGGGDRTAAPTVKPFKAEEARGATENKTVADQENDKDKKKKEVIVEETAASSVTKVLEEASKMLRSLNKTSGVKNGKERENRLEMLQKQLDEIRGDPRLNQAQVSSLSRAVGVAGLRGHPSTSRVQTFGKP